MVRLTNKHILSVIALFCILALCLLASYPCKALEQTASSQIYEYTSSNGTVFTTTLGSADVRVNNTKLSPASAKFIPNKAGGETVRIEDYNKGCDLAVAAPLNYFTENTIYTRDTINNLTPGTFSIQAPEGPINSIGFIEEDYIVDGSITVLQYNKTVLCKFFITASYYEDVAKTSLVQLEAFVVVSYKDVSTGTGTLPSTPDYSGSSGSQYSMPTSSQCTMCYGSGICQACHGRSQSYVTGYGVTDGTTVACEGCHGTGKCWRCGGTGIEPGY